MPRPAWKTVRDRAITVNFDYHKEPLTVYFASGNPLELEGVLDTGTSETGVADADGAYIQRAQLSVRKADIGALPEVGEQITVVRAEDQREAMYMVTGTDDTHATLYDINLQAHDY